MIAKRFRLHKKRDFDELSKSSNKFYSNNFILRFTDNNKDISCFAVVISKKVNPKAVVRNKTKRRIYEAIRLNLDKINKGFNIIIFVKKGVLDLNYQDIEKELLYILEKANLLV